MALKIWLPLINDVHNQGASGVTITNTSSTFVTGGKIGNAIQFGTAKSYLKLDDVTPFHSMTECSISLWIKILSWNTSYATYFQFGLGTTPWTSYILGLLRNNTASTLCFTIANGSNSTQAGCLTPALDLNTWYHLTFTYKDNHCKIYTNGIETRDYTTQYAPNFAGITNGIIGACNNGSNYQTNCLMNDFRIYDHCLSAAEVREIAQGLVLHYKLDRGGSSSNLIINGDGKSGTANWATPANTSTEVPSTEYGRSFFYNTIKEFVPINASHQYKIEEWIKANSGATGTTYPSLYPYDIDKKFIQYYHIAFNGSTLTTLTRALNPGDTKIYVESLANWNANSGHWYNYAALFSYQDSTGYVYPDLTYTQNTPAFASSTAAKTNLDKANNIITLNSAYTGPALPIGTKVCASTAGSSYWYPYGGINMASIQEWTHKTYTFIPKNDGRLRYAHFIKYFTYAQNNVLHAGIKLTDLSESNDIEDSSGYSHNGTIIGDLILGEKQGRYSNSLRWNSSAPTASSEEGICYIQTPFTLTTPLQMSVTWWAKPESGYGGSTNHAAFCTSNNASRPSDYNTTAFHHRDAGFDIYPSDASGVKRLSFTYTANAWHHYAITYDGSTAKAYQDGVLKTSVAVGTNKTLATFSQLYIGFSQAGGAKRKTLGSYSDFRIYITALSADDILQLYHTSAKIDNKQNLHAFELVEPATRISINKQGQILCNELEETSTTKFFKTNQIIETNEIIEL